MILHERAPGERRIIGADGIIADDVYRMFNSAIRGQGRPRHLSTDHGPVFKAPRWAASLLIVEIDEIKTVPHVPLSHPFVERVIGTMRREFLACSASGCGASEANP